MTVQIGKYKRPGIFVEEYDKSIIVSPANDGISNLVIGVSRKGPINTPVLLTNTSDLETIYGSIDRNLERKGSYFHRTIAKMLESSPVYAFNILKTDDVLDKIQYQSLSTCVATDNDDIREDAYRKFFDTTGFWKRDAESFIDLTRKNDGFNKRVLNFTNLSDKYITVFIIKSQMGGFDKSLLEWYGNEQKVPAYVNKNDYASDYLVDVVVVAGDWSNYKVLSVDSHWSQYFNTSGLIKSEIRNFANDNNVSLLAYYDGLSLIPNFRNSNGKNIFIQTVINNETNSTGLFCSFNEDLVESDYPNGLIDIVGQTIADENETDINFLSYKETIAETITILNTPLDLPGNVIGLIKDDDVNKHAFATETDNYPQTSGVINALTRTHYYIDDYIYNASVGTLSSTNITVNNLTNYDDGGVTPTTDDNKYYYYNTTDKKIYSYTLATSSLTKALYYDGTNYKYYDNGFTTASIDNTCTISAVPPTLTTANIGQKYLNGDKIYTIKYDYNDGESNTNKNFYSYNNQYYYKTNIITNIISMPIVGTAPTTVTTDTLCKADNMIYHISGQSTPATSNTIYNDTTDTTIYYYVGTDLASSTTLGTQIDVNAISDGVPTYTTGVEGNTCYDTTDDKLYTIKIKSVESSVVANTLYQNLDSTSDTKFIYYTPSSTQETPDSIKKCTTIDAFVVPSLIKKGATYSDATMLYTTKEEQKTSTDTYYRYTIDGTSKVVKYNGTGLVDVKSTDISPTFSIVYDLHSYAVIENTLVTLNSTTASIDNIQTILASDFVPSYNTSKLYYTRTYTLNINGEINHYDVTTGATSSDTIKTYAVSTSEIVLGYVVIGIESGIITDAVYKPIYLNNDGYIYLKHGDTENDDYHITSSNEDGIITITFNNTANKAITSDYKQYRRIKLFNKLVNNILSTNKDNMVLNLGDGDYKKYSFSNITITDIVTDTTTNKSFKLNTGLSNGDLTNILNGYLVIYMKDNEMIIGNEKTITKDSLPGKSEGVVANNSVLYRKYYDGIINSGDFFYKNALGGNTYASITFDTGSNATISTYKDKSYIVFSNKDINGGKSIDPSSINSNFGVGYKFIVPQSTMNSGIFTISNTLNIYNPVELAKKIGYKADDNTEYYAFELSQNCVQESLIMDITYIYDSESKVYLKMYMDSVDNMIIEYYADAEYSSKISDLSLKENSVIRIQSAKSNYKQTIEIENLDGYTPVPNKILVKANRYGEVKVGDYLLANYDATSLQSDEMPRKMTRITSKRAYKENTNYTEISCDAEIKKLNYDGDQQTLRFTSIDDYVDTYKAIVLKGFRIRQASMPDGTEDRQNEILNMVASGTPLFKALCNKDAIDFRYLIDSFGLGLIENSKQQLVDICGNRLDCFGFINMPSMKEFKNSTSPSFVNSEYVLQTEYIAKGGNPESSPLFLYSFGTGKGTTAVGYFMPYLNINDNGRIISVPPSSYVATTYMRKHNSTMTNIVPWTIAAGTTNGKITDINSLEMTFTLEDIENLNSIGHMNPIVYKRNRGYVIETENTAQTAYYSSLSYIHCREVLIELERELTKMLLDYQWKFNTPDVRAEIKLKADTICDTYVNKNGLYNYFNKMDDENNTSDIIDNQMGVIDTYVECIKGMEYIVNNMTILRTGAIQAGGFI